MVIAAEQRGYLALPLALATSSSRDEHGVHLGNFDRKLIASVRVRRFDGADTWRFLDE